MRLGGSAYEDRLQLLIAKGTRVLSIRCIPLLAAALCNPAAAHSLQEAVFWMTEPKPFSVASIKRHFGAKVDARCAGTPGAFECVALDDKLDMHWRAGTEEGDASEGHLRLPVGGCLRRQEAEEVLGSPLRFAADHLPEKSRIVKRTTRYWTPARIWRVDVAFENECATLVTIATPPS